MNYKTKLRVLSKTLPRLRFACACLATISRIRDVVHRRRVHEAASIRELCPAAYREESEFEKTGRPASDLARGGEKTDRDK